MDHIHQINISKGGVPKLPVKSVYISKKGLVGDKQKNSKYHDGSPTDRAVCLLSMDVIEKLQQKQHPIYPGSTGENLTIYYNDYSLLHQGVKLQLGDDVVIEIVAHTAPCKTVRASFLEGEFNTISQQVNPGYSRFYAKVLCEGWVKKGDLIQKKE